MWDLAISILDPIVINTPVNQVPLTSVVYSLNAHALYVGDSEGNTTVFQLSECEEETSETENETDRLTRIVKSSLPADCHDVTT